MISFDCKPSNYVHRCGNKIGYFAAIKYRSVYAEDVFVEIDVWTHLKINFETICDLDNFDEELYVCPDSMETLHHQCNGKTVRKSQCPIR